MPEDTPFHDLTRYVALPRVNGLALSPDGSRLVATVARPDQEGKKYTSALWAIDPTGARPARRLTRSAKGEGPPVFLPSGDVLFVSGRPDPAAKPDGDDEAQLWLLPADGGEAHTVVTRPGGVGGVTTARASDTIVVQASVHPGAADEDADAAHRKARKDAGVSAILHEATPVRHWDHDLGPAETRLFATTADANADHFPALHDLTPVPGRALDNVNVALSPDGATAVVSWTVREADGYLRRELRAVDTATGDQRVLATEPDADFEGPVVSPDGAWVACVRSTHNTYDEAGEATLWLVSLDGSTGRNLTPRLDRWPTELAWAPDGSAVFLAADEGGRAPIFRVEIDDGAVTRLTASGAYTSLSPSPDGQAIFALRAAWDHPPAPVWLDAHDADQEAVALLGPPDTDPAVPGTLTEVFAAAADGTPLRAWLVLPEGASADAPVPLILWMHGGPVNSWNAWSWRWCPWLLAARGYAVLLPDPAFSTGYGRSMVQRGWGQWGGAPYTDLMTITNVALERPDLDAERTGAMGGSYGGYLANWVAGHTDRFRAIVTHASLWALDQFAQTTDLPAFWRREWGDPDKQPERYDTWSPHRFAAAITTPMLVVHGDRDYRVPIGEGLRLWDELVRRGVDAKFLYFPDENHWVLTPGNAFVWYETVLGFLDHHVLGKEWVRPELV